MKINSNFVLTAWMCLLQAFFGVAHFVDNGYHENGTDVENHEKYVGYGELSDYTEKFMMTPIKDYQEFDFDPVGFQIVVGARDHLFRLSLVGLQLLEHSEWSSDQRTVETCLMKGKSPEKCKNYIRLIHFHDGKIFVCGTNAFSPICSWRSLSNLNEIEEKVIGIGMSPFDPEHSVTSLMTSDGSLYVGTRTDFVGSDSAFIKITGNNRLRTKQYDSKWLSEPNFVSSFESGSFVYFLFAENAVENMNIGKRVISRIGRVCKNDPGGSMKLKYVWTTFLKARLNCSRPGKYPFSYDYLQSATYLPMEQMIYGVFTTDPNGLMGSAICGFNMSLINASFDDKSSFTCKEGREGLGTKAASLATDKYQLMDEAVQPINQSPFITIDHQKLNHIAVDVVRTRQSGVIHVVYVAAEDNTIRKFSVIPATESEQPKICLLEILQPIPNNSSNRILKLKFLKETNSLYIGTDNEILRIPVNHCDRYKERGACLNAKDPYCGWDINTLECKTAPNEDIKTPSWKQEVMDCPINTEPVGNWGRWSEWENCQQADTDDHCKCRHRKCNSPKPIRGGLECRGESTQVKNCSVRGGRTSIEKDQDEGWSSWSVWSSCTANCGGGTQNRRRTCNKGSCLGSSSEARACNPQPCIGFMAALANYLEKIMSLL